jgi:hypothetical protein
MCDALDLKMFCSGSPLFYISSRHKKQSSTTLLTLISVHMPVLRSDHKYKIVILYYYIIA